MINCIIIDDEPLAAQLLSSYADKVEDIQLLGVFHNPLSALTFLKDQKVDLVFLDIQMPELSGTQLAKIVDPGIEIIFTTAYSEFAVEGFELKALDYLVKPISFIRFLDAIDRYRSLHVEQNTIQDDPQQFLFVKSEYRLQKINTSDILYLQGNGDYCNIVSADKKILTLEKLSSFETRLSPRQFIRVHKSYIIAIEKIEYIEKKRIKIGDEMIPIGLTYEEGVRKIVG